MCGCMKRGKTLEYDEIGLHRKLVNKGAREFMCIECLSEYFDVSVEALREKIEQYKQSGCSLFK